MNLFDYLGGLWNPSTVGKGQIQTDRSFGTTWLKRAFAEHPMKGITPASLSTIMEQAERGNLRLQHELFLDMEERDPHLHAEMSKRKRTVIGLPRQVMPPTKPSKEELQLTTQLNDIIKNIPDFDTLLLDLLDAIGHGFSCSEITWGFTDGVWLPTKFEHRPQYWFQLDTNTRTEIRLRNMSVDGDPLWPFGWIIHKHGAKSGELSRSGLYRVLAWPWLMKQYSLRDLAEYLEIYGLPVKIGKYPRNAPDDDKDQLYKALQQLGRNVAGIMPEDVSIEFLKESLGSALPFMSMIEYCDSVMSMAIIGQTLSGKSSNTGLGSGVATLQSDVRQDLLEADANQLSNTITKQLLQPLLTLNGWGKGRPFTYFFDTSTTEDLTIFSGAVHNFVASGLPLPVDWIYRKAGIPAPDPADKVIQFSPVSTATSPMLATSNVAATTTATLPEDSTAVLLPNYLDTNAKQLMSDMSPIMDAMLGKVRTLLKECSSLEEFKTKLVKLFPNAEAKDLATILARAFAASQLAGMYAIKNHKQQPL